MCTQLVDGGHRAIKYTRLGGVKKDIYSEGTASFPSDKTANGIRTDNLTVLLLFRNPFPDPVV
jgi:hypothetical protein